MFRRTRQQNKSFIQFIELKVFFFAPFHSIQFEMIRKSRCCNFFKFAIKNNQKITRFVPRILPIDRFSAFERKFRSTHAEQQNVKGSGKAFILSFHLLKLRQCLIRYHPEHSMVTLLTCKIRRQQRPPPSLLQSMKYIFLDRVIRINPLHPKGSFFVLRCVCLRTQCKWCILFMNTKKSNMIYKQKFKINE